MACRRRLVGSMRRGGGVENLIDKKLEADIHRYIHLSILPTCSVQHINVISQSVTVDIT